MKGITYAPCMIVVLCVVSIGSIVAQSFAFRNNAPVLWHHLVNGGRYEDIINYSFLVNELDGVKILENGLYLAHYNIIKFYEGYTVEKLDLTTGEVLWSHTILGNDNMNRELPNVPYFTGDSALNFLIYRQKDTTNKNTLWIKSVFGFRRYDLQTGLVVDSSFAARDIKNAAMLLMPKSPYIPRMSLLYPDPNHSDTFYNMDRFMNPSSILSTLIKLDREGISIDTLRFSTDLKHSIDGYSYKIPRIGSIITLFYSTTPAEDGRWLTLELLKINGLNFDTILIDLSDVVSLSDRCFLDYADTSKFAIQCIKEKDNLTEIRLYVFDYHSKLLQSVEIKADKTDMPNITVSNPVVLKNENKMLFAVSWKKDSVVSVIAFVEYDKIGNEEVVGILETMAEHSVIRPDELDHVVQGRTLPNHRN